MRMTENPEIGVFVHIPNPAGFFVQPDRGGGAVVSVPVSHARVHVVSAAQLTDLEKRSRHGPQVGYFCCSAQLVERPLPSAAGIQTLLVSSS